MTKTVIINVPEIQKQIKLKHKKFLKDVGIFSCKISQDHQLNLTRLIARITRIMECFVEEKIIDQFTPYLLPYIDGEYTRAFCLRKNEFANSAYLWTNGEYIVFGVPVVDSNCESIRDIDLNNFDGVEFSEKLLDYIHRKIYLRKESYEQSIFGTVSSPRISNIIKEKNNE